LKQDSWRMELIAISRGERYDGIRPKVDEKPLEEFYNVMWIGWNGNIAYRRALGEVNRNTWESIRPEKIEITLG